MNVRRPLREYVFDHSISHDQLTALGRIVVEAAQLEDAVEWAIWGLLGLKAHVGVLFTTRQNMEAKVNTLIRVAWKVLPEGPQRAEMADLAGRLRDSSGRRNELVHAVWPGHPTLKGDVALSRKLGRKKVDSKAIKADLPTLMAIATDLRADHDDLLGFLDRVSDFKQPYIRGKDLAT
jgi:hypothetical protein